MEMLIALFITPLANMAENPEFVLEVVIGGLLSGVMYSLVALGFVLIFKASGVFNFAQGTMVLFAALTFVGMIERGVPIWGAFVIAAAVMVLLAFAIERLMLRPLVNQEPIILFMATIGLAFFLDGFGQLVWGSDVHPLDIGIPKAPLIIGGAGEKLAEVFWGPALGGAIQEWFAYALALAFLLFRPQGLFGERIIERV